MNIENDTIPLESRREIESIMTILGEYIKRHEKEDTSEVQTAGNLYDELDYMHMCW